MKGLDTIKAENRAKARRIDERQKHVAKKVMAAATAALTPAAALRATILELQQRKAKIADLIDGLREHLDEAEARARCQHCVDDDLRCVPWCAACRIAREDGGAA